MNRRNFLKRMTASSAVLGLAAQMPLVLAQSRGEPARCGLILPQCLAQTGRGTGIVEGARAAVPHLRIETLPAIGALPGVDALHRACAVERWVLVSTPAEVEVFQTCLHSNGGQILARGEHVHGATASRHQWLAASSHCSPAGVLAEHFAPSADLLVSERFLESVPGSAPPLPGFTCWQAGDFEVHGAGGVTLSAALNRLPRIKGSRARSYQVVQGPPPMRPAVSSVLGVLGYALVRAATWPTPGSGARERYFLKAAAKPRLTMTPRARQLSSLIFEI